MRPEQKNISINVRVIAITVALAMGHKCFSQLLPKSGFEQIAFAVDKKSREHLRIIIECLLFRVYQLEVEDVTRMFYDCAYESPGNPNVSKRVNGFWRVDKEKTPEQREPNRILKAYEIWFRSNWSFTKIDAWLSNADTFRREIE